MATGRFGKLDVHLEHGGAGRAIDICVSDRSLPLCWPQSQLSRHSLHGYENAHFYREPPSKRAFSHMNESLRGKTIVFDLDGTLVDTAPDLAAATNYVTAQVGAEPLEARSIRPFISFGARWMIVEALKKNTITLDDNEVDQLLETFLTYYRKNIAVHSRPYPGAVDALDALRARGAVLAVCTNKREALSLALLGALGLTEKFRAVIGRDTLDVFKPHPGHILGTVERAGGDARHAVMVGDSANDIAAAKAAGVPSIAVEFGYSSGPAADLGADALIQSYDQLVAAVEGLWSQ